MDIEQFIKIIDSDFYVGVPDSQLKPLCNYLMNTYGIDRYHHIISANEGLCVATAAGYYLSTSKIPVVYLQNSGEGNIINPVTSLLNDKVYAIPMIFIIGWRGEPGVQDEPQHIYQGQITTKLLEDLDISYFILDKDVKEKELSETMKSFRILLSKGKSVAFVIKKGAFLYDKNIEYKNNYKISREDIIKHIVKYSQNDPIISTTGKASRELFEIREMNQQGHRYDFLTVGSMGGSSSIALGIALNKKDTKIWCIDGDGAMLMHMGALAVIGSFSPNNLVHIVINNVSHETVGGLPTVAGSIDMVGIAKSCGYSYVKSVDNVADLDRELEYVRNNDVLSFIEVKSLIGSRKDLGRPTTTPLDNKVNFMRYLDGI